ncbi:MAG TPA: hypothetical protein VMX58_09555 [Patescibacteria group bacterium]|nr:hypothetical protein [Patescibacteria group bacterium]
MWIAAILLSQILLAIVLTIVRRLTEIKKPALAVFGCELLFVPPLLALAESKEMPHPGIVIACLASLIIGYVLLGGSMTGRGTVPSN